MSDLLDFGCGPGKPGKQFTDEYEDTKTREEPFPDILLNEADPLTSPSTSPIADVQFVWKYQVRARIRIAYYVADPER